MRELPADRDPDRDIDAAFEDIVARWGEAPVEPERPRPPAVAADPRPEASPNGDATGPVAEPRPEGVPASEPATDPTRDGDASSPAVPLLPRSPAGYAIPAVPAPEQGQEHFGHRAYTVPEADLDEFVPPDPAPMPDPETDPQFWWIVGCLGGGPLLMLALILTGHASGWFMALAVVAVVIGFGLLVLRGGREPRDPGDDGARV